MAFVVVAKWTAQEGEAGRVLGYIERLAAPSRGEEGNLEYRVHRDPENENVFLFYEVYADEAGYEAHLDSAHFREFGFGGAIPLLAGRERAFYEPAGI